MQRLILTTYKLRRILLVAGVIVFLVFLHLNAPPEKFPKGTTVTIKKGSTLFSIAETLQEKNVIKSPFIFRMYVIMMGGEKALVEGSYLFKEKNSTLSVARRIVSGHLGILPIRVTIPEGATVKEIATIFENRFPDFNYNEFLALTKDKEGYLFPDTYLFFPSITAEDVALKLQKTFEDKIGTLKISFALSKRTLNDIIIMASVLEEEARTTETREIISGILWRRIDIGMPLQVDAPFIYERSKNTFDLTTEDLRKDSPYNTYTRKGLPPTPISNPGLDSIKAALEPTPSKYLYYLSDAKGEMHYAVTHEEHVANKRKYLK